MLKVERPAAPEKKIHCRDEFELCYLRHQYLRKATNNPTSEEMAPYSAIVNHQARNTYFTYANLFIAVGLGSDDVLSIANTHVVSYLGLFSLESSKDKNDNFVFNHCANKGRIPGEKDLLGKNKADFTMFLKQRMEDLVRVCRQKVRNIKGLPGKEHYIYCGERKPPKVLRDLEDNYASYGYRKLDVASFKTARKRAKKGHALTFQFGGLWYIYLANENRHLDLSDLSGAGMDPYDSIHNMSPDRIYADREEVSFWQGKREEFESYLPRKRARLLRSFINKHKNKPKFKEEVKLARKLIKATGV